MKTPKLLAVLFSCGLLSAALVQAQDQSAPSEGRRGRGEGRGMMTPEQRVEQLDKVLSLSADQKAKIKDIYTKAQEEMRAVMRDGGGDRDAAREKMMAAMRKTREDVRAVLTDEQKKKFDDMPQRGPGGGDQGGRRGKRGGKEN